MTSDAHSRAKAIFLAVLDHPPEERDRRVAEASGDDTALRREVQDLLEHHDPRSIVGERAEAPAQGSWPGRVLQPRRTGTSGITRPRLLARRPFWVAVALLGLFAVATWGKGRVEWAQLRARGNELGAILNANVAALDRWVDDQKVKARLYTRDPRIVPHVEELLRIAEVEDVAGEALRASPARRALEELWEPLGSEFPHRGIGLLNERGQSIFDQHEPAIGVFTSPLSMSHQARVLAGDTVFVRPHRLSDIVRGDTPVDLHEMSAFVGAPVRDDRGRVIASFWLVFPANGQFSEILETARVGETGETYAFDEMGLMLSSSRFQEELRQLGALPPDDDPTRAWDRGTQLNLSIRDPGGDLREVDLERLDLDVRPLTRLATTAIARRTKADPAERRGLLTEPYRGYRGVEVIGAWRWHEAYDLALATEMDVSEALAPLHSLDAVFLVLFGLLAVFLGTTLVSSLSALTLRRRVAHLRQLGQYSLLEPLAEGGMGTVYRAEHALLKRPTAVKVLSESLLTEEGVARFEREVRLASQLTHPNTIAIYDYGRTPDGVFYYAMELVEGPTLAEVVAREGPLPPRRVAHILRQACLSLGEAHGQGLVHRDVKPANIMLCERGGVRDVVKVLDFGLVKDAAKGHTRDLTVPNQVGGTPLYMAPERLTATETVDARSDIYSLGAVAYLLLTGRPVFTHTSDADLLWKVVHVAPDPMHATPPVPAELERLVLRCLAKDPGERPQDVRELLHELDAVAGPGSVPRPAPGP